MRSIRLKVCPRASIITDQVVPVTPAPMIQKYCKKVSSLSFKNLGVYSTNPLVLKQKGPLSDIPIVSDGKLIEDVEQIDTNIFQVDVTDEDGTIKKFTVIVPLEED